MKNLTDQITYQKLIRRERLLLFILCTFYLPGYGQVDSCRYVSLEELMKSTQLYRNAVNYENTKDSAYRIVVNNFTSFIQDSIPHRVGTEQIETVQAKIDSNSAYLHFVVDSLKNRSDLYSDSLENTKSEVVDSIVSYFSSKNVQFVWEKDLNDNCPDPKNITHEVMFLVNRNSW
jgi:hypothetical protein